MGLFSSKKEDSNGSVASTPRKEDKSVVQAIRSRFHGKKGKEREDPKAPFSRGPSSSISIASSPLPNNKRHTRSIISVPSFRRAVLDRAAASSHERAQAVEPISTPEKAQSSRSVLLRNQSPSGTSTSTVSRRTTDSITVTLAQRLNELASANSEGLLSDDEYRVLRQSLFERLATSAAVPSEPSVVPVPSAPATDSEPSTSRHISKLRVDRPPSIVSLGTSNSHSLLRRVTDRRPNTNDRSDTSSIMSTKSNTSLFKMPRLLSRKPSDISVRTAASRAQTDAVSVSSRRVSSDKGHGDYPIPPSTPRSAAGSIRRMPVPPSSFNARVISQARHSAIYNAFDENHLSTVQDIQQEISNVEGEQKRLMDAFNGLEFTTLTRRQRLPPYQRSTEFSKASNTIWGDSDGRLQIRDLADDGISLRSGTSAGTSPSMARSAHGLRTKMPIGNSPPPPLPLIRKGSLSSVDDRRTPVPLPLSQGHLQAASKSNLSLHSRSSRAAVADDERLSFTVHMDVGDSLDGELEDIRRRREEVNHRYEARLEYLRAKLKGAQLHEKLLRR